MSGNGFENKYYKSLRNISVLFTSAALFIALFLSFVQAGVPYSAAYAQEAKSAVKQAKTKAKAPAGENKSQKKSKNDKTAGENKNAADNKIIEAKQPSAAFKNVGGYIENTVLKNANVDMLKLINETARLITAVSGEETVKLNIYNAFFSSDSNEIRLLLTKTYNKPVSLKADYVSKYKTSDYFAFESDVLGFRGYQIISKPSAKSYIDMVCYQISTDSIFLAYALADSGAAGANVRPKLTMEPGFFRSAVISAKEFTNNEEFSFFDTGLLKKFKPKKGVESLCAQSSITVGGSRPSVFIYSYTNPGASQDSFKNFSVSRGAVAENVSEKHKKDGEFNYYLSARHIIAVSNALY